MVAIPAEHRTASLILNWSSAGLSHLSRAGPGIEASGCTRPPKFPLIPLIVPRGTEGALGTLNVQASPAVLKL